MDSWRCKYKRYFMEFIMVINVTFRHHIQNDALRKLINKQCLDLKKSFLDITSFHVVFSVVSHKNKLKPLIQCHLSVHIAHQKNVEVFDDNTKASTAYHTAFSQLRDKLLRIKAYNLNKNKHNVIYFQQTA